MTTTINLLSPEGKKRVRKIYRFRLGIVALALTFILLSIASVSLLPSLFLIGVKEGRLTEGLSVRKEEVAPGVNKDIELLIRETRKQMDVLIKGDGTEISEAVLDILGTKGSTITILGFFFQKIYSDKASEDRLVVRGRASTRNSLISFADRLKENSLFESVDLPVSDLVQSSDITFSITTVIKRNKKES